MRGTPILAVGLMATCALLLNTLLTRNWAAELQHETVDIEKLKALVGCTANQGLHDCVEAASAEKQNQDTAKQEQVESHSNISITPEIKGDPINQLRIDAFNASNVALSPNSSSAAHPTPGVIYGHVHMAKTGGTSLNGELAMHYERVCGHKGYSFDAVGVNRRFNNSGWKSNDAYAKIKPGFSRGRVWAGLMDEIGYHDCDWISFERPWKDWVKQLSDWQIPLELHVPCRSPVDHLMSQCNQRNRTFNCTGDKVELEKMIDSCMVKPDRFNKALGDTFPLKCFDFRKVNQYMDWIGERLEKKRIETQYIMRHTNQKRDKDRECVWKDAQIQEYIELYMIEHFDYYSFCDKCLGSDNDIFSESDF